MKLLESDRVTFFKCPIILIFVLKALISKMYVLVLVIKAEFLRTGANVPTPIEVYFVFAVHHAPNTDIKLPFFVQQGSFNILLNYA